MSRPPLTIWEQAQMQGYSRRDFLQFCSWIAAAAGIHASGVPQVVEALDSKPRPTVVWFHFQECTCCSESFIRSNHPIVSDIILDKISLDYTETLQAAAGAQAHEALKTAMEKNKGKYLMLVEGSVPLAEDGVYCCIGGRSAADIVKEAAAGAAAVICWGSCASNGCIQSAKPNPTRATPIEDVVSGVPIIKVPGCRLERLRVVEGDLVQDDVRHDRVVGPDERLAAAGALLEVEPHHRRPRLGVQRFNHPRDA